jgi:PAS domain S-box-containing protein
MMNGGDNLMQGIKILIVEDAAIVAKDIQHTLERLGYAVSAVVSSGEDAIKQAVEIHPDLVLMDIVLKGELDGIEAAERIRAECDIPIVFLTAHEDDVTLQRAKITEPFGYILKPFKERELDIGIQIALYRHQMEKRLRESEERYRRIVETAYEGIWAIDEENRTTFVNDRMAEMLGYDTEEMCDQPLLAFADEEWLTIARAKVARHREGVPEQYEFKFRRADGSDLWTIVSATPLLDKRGQYAGTLAMVTDITLHKQAEEKLLESEQQYRDLVENIDDVLYAVDEDGIVTYVSPAVESFIGYGPSEVIGRSFADFIHDEDAHRIREGFRVLLSGRTATNEYRVLHKSGTTCWVRTSSRPLLSGDRVVGVRGVLVDITKRREIESALRESESRLRSIFENAAVGIALTDADERFVDFNDTWCNMVGYSREELLGLTPRDVSAEGEPVVKFGSLDEGATEKKHVRLEKRYRRKDGTEFWGDLSISVLSDGDGRPGRMLGIIRDISERKQAEAALKESEAKFRSLAQQSPNMIFINQDGRIAYVNAKCEEVMGFSREEFLAPGFEFTALIAPESVDKIRANFRKHLDGQDLPPYEYALITKGGQRIEALITTKLISYDGERAILGIVTDITERVQIEEALQQYNRSLELLNQVSQALIATLDLPHIFERLLRAAVEIAHAEGSSVWLWDEDRPGELVCRAIYHQGEFRSPRDLRLGPGRGIAGWVAQKGESAAVTNAQGDSRFFPGVDRKIDFRTTSLLAVPLRMREHIHGVLEVVNKTGDPIYRGVASFDADDRVLVEMLAASAAIAIDNARLIDALRQYGMELEARNQDLDAFAHTVAHDLKNPLAYMVGFAELLEEDAAVMPEEAVRRYLHTIAQNGRKMTNIIDELLLLAGVRQLEQVALARLDMMEIVADAQRRLGDLIREHEAKITVPDSWPAAMGHGPWVEEVWVNFISNAVKYGGNPPRVELGADQQDDGDVRFWVRDNGSGLTREEQARLFTSFERLDRVRAKGHGLGLSIARRIVEKLGGQVGVASRVGHGSVFSFTLPSAER